MDFDLKESVVEAEVFKQMSEVGLVMLEVEKREFLLKALFLPSNELFHCHL